MHADDGRVDRLERIPGQAQLRRPVAAQIVQDAVGRAHQIVQHLPARLLLEVERHRALVAVERLEEQAVALGQRVLRMAHEAPDIAAFGNVLHLDDLGAEVRKLHRAERPGPVLLHRNDADPLQRQHHVLSQALEQL